MVVIAIEFFTHVRRGHESIIIPERVARVIKFVLRLDRGKEPLQNQTGDKLIVGVQNVVDRGANLFGGSIAKEPPREPGGPIVIPKPVAQNQGFSGGQGTPSSVASSKSP